MKFSADSSILARLYLDADGAPELERFLADGNKSLSISELARIEVLNVLLRHPESSATVRFDQDLAEGLRLHVDRIDWSVAFRQAESLARRFSKTLKPGAHDLLLVAAAVTAGSSWFLSLDRASSQRALAGAAGLRVWPPLDKNESGLIRTAARLSG
jgi:predicted nucleic acid-binding protein